ESRPKASAASPRSGSPPRRREGPGEGSANTNTLRPRGYLARDDDPDDIRRAQDKPGSEGACRKLHGDDPAEQRADRHQRQSDIDQPEAGRRPPLVNEVAHERHFLPPDERAITRLPDEERHDLVEIAQRVLPQPADQRRQSQRGEESRRPPAEDRGGDPQR